MMALWLMICMFLIPVFGTLAKYYLERDVFPGFILFLILAVGTYLYVVYTVLDLLVRAARI